MAEQLICNQQVVGSTPTTSSKRGKIPEWPKGADCKSVGTAFGGSNPPLPTRKTVRKRAVFLLYFGGFGVVKTQRTREIPARTTVVLTLRFRVQARTLRYSVALLLTNPPLPHIRVDSEPPVSVLDAPLKNFIRLPFLLFHFYYKSIVFQSKNVI